MLNVLFNTLLTITLHNTQKRRRRRERTTYGPLTRYSPLVTRPVRNPDRQGLTCVPLPNRVSRRLLRDTYFYRVKKLFSSTAQLFGIKELDLSDTNQQRGSTEL